MTFTVPSWLVRPLGRGYGDLDSFLAPYLSSNGHGHDRSPDAAASLHRLQSDAAIAGHLRTLGPSPVCLIEGISSPANGRSLRRFLSACGIDDPRIRAIDLADMAEIFRLLGEPLAEAEFEVADASYLEGFESGSIDFLLQDFLLNCAPHCLHEAILSEAVRVLRPGGLALINFTDDAGLLHKPTIYHPWPLEPAYGATDLPHFEHSLRPGVVLRGPGRENLTLVTGSLNFEFYSSRRATEKLLAAGGLELLASRRWSGADHHGNQCCRHLTLLRRSGDV